LEKAENGFVLETVCSALESPWDYDCVMWRDGDSEQVVWARNADNAKVCHISKEVATSLKGLVVRVKGGEFANGARARKKAGATEPIVRCLI
jgi:hypothetical protein